MSNRDIIAHMRFFLGLILLVVMVIAVVYGIPKDWKQQGIALLGRAKVIPVAIQEKIESVILTPAEKREKVIKAIENNLSELKSGTNTDNSAIVAKLENLLMELKSQNKDSPSVINTVINRVIDQVLPSAAPAPASQENKTAVSAPVPNNSNNSSTNCPTTSTLRALESFL